MKKVSFVIPCYYSENTLSSVVAEIKQTMETMRSEYSYEIILINDCSMDNTYGVICELAENSENIIGLDLAKNFGQHSALMAGFHFASGDIVVCLDDDGQTPASEVGKLLDKLENGEDVVYAGYESKKHSSFRNWGSRINALMTEMMLGKPKGLYMGSYLAMHRFVLEEILRYEQCYPYVDGLILRATKRICNVSVEHRAREEGQSGYTLKKLLSLWMNGFTSFSVKPLRWATLLGALIAGGGFLYLLYIVISYFVAGDALLGWSSTMAVILILGGVVLVELGLIGEYIGRIFMCTNAAPQYVIRNQTKSRNMDNM